MKKRFNNAVQFTITAVSLIMILFIVIFSNKTGQIDIKAGDVSSTDVYAPRSIIDETTTDASKKAARDSVENVYICNDDKRIAAVDGVNNIFSLASNLRSDKNVSVSAGAAQLGAKSKINLSENSCAAIIGASKSEFSQLRNISDIINTLMSDGISDINTALTKFETEIEKLKITAAQHDAVLEIASSLMTENLELNEVETERRRKDAENAVPSIEYKKNQIILRKGEIVSEAQLNMMKELGIVKGTNPLSATYTTGVIILCALCFLMLILFFVKCEQKCSSSASIISFMSAVTLLLSFFGSKYIPEKFFPLFPAGYFASIITIFSFTQAGIISNIIISIFCGIAFEADWKYTVIMIIGGTIACFFFGKIKRRSHLFHASVLSSIAFSLAYFSMSLIESNGFSFALGKAGFGFIGGIFSGIITIGTLPFLEWLFNYTTPMKLTELANPENKLLKKLLVEAPGTYHHSLTVANIAEIAAREVNADSLLARVGAYYHDIGKLRHPLYYKENQYDTNTHDSLEPEESAKLIISHVTDGAEIAEKNRLPQSICDIITQHHGTSTTGYFLIRAKEKNPDTDPSSFTYPGPVPQSKEAAIVMLADSCEAAVRSLTEKNEETIEAMVRKIADDRVNSGQFSQCNLTFMELEKIICTIIKTLGGYFHERIKYE